MCFLRRLENKDFSTFLSKHCKIIYTLIIEFSMIFWPTIYLVVCFSCTCQLINLVIKTNHYWCWYTPLTGNRVNLINLVVETLPRVFRCSLARHFSFSMWCIFHPPLTRCTSALHLASTQYRGNVWNGGISCKFTLTWTGLHWIVFHIVTHFQLHGTNSVTTKQKFWNWSKKIGVTLKIDIILFLL